MTELRPLIAIFSCTVGLVVLGIAVRAVSGSRHGKASGTLFLYGVLFVGAALLLWRRQDHPATASASESPAKEEHITSQPPAQASKPDLNAIAERDTLPEIEERPPAVQRPRIARPNPNAAVIAAPSEPSLPPEQQVYSVVSRAFEVIENWFDRFGSPVPSIPERRLSVKHHVSKASPDGLSFPVIQFAAGSAELTRDSQKALCGLAEILTADSSSAVVEILGHGAEDGPEAFRFILSQARAQTVHDFLVEAGVNTRKLATRTLSSDPRDSTKADSQIEFVVRR